MYEGGIESKEATFQFNSFKWSDPALTTYVIHCTGKVCDQSGSNTCATVRLQLIDLKSI